MKEWFQITTNPKCVKRITKYLKLFNHTNYHIYNKHNNNNDEVIIEVFGYKRLIQRIFKKICYGSKITTI